MTPKSLESPSTKDGPQGGFFPEAASLRRKRRLSMMRSSFRLTLFLAAVLSLPVLAVADSDSPGYLSVPPGFADSAAGSSGYDNATQSPPPDSQAMDNDAMIDDARPEEEHGGLLDKRWELRKESKRGVFQLRYYKPIYLAPYSVTSKRNTTPSTPNPKNTVTQPISLDSAEAKFQLSFKFKIAEEIFGKNLDLWGAYTQSSHWQVYNSGDSRPFRETNYEPEILLTAATDYGAMGWRGRMLGVGLNHQSNGRSLPLSRSWNRVVVFAGFDREDWAIMARAWRRINESPDKDDNRDISDYVGRCDVTVTRVLGDHQLSLMARHSLKTGDRSHGAVHLEWAFPISAPLRGNVQLFHGYGESMVDYNFKSTWVILGFSLAEWF